MTEFALLVPVLILLALGILEFGRAYFAYSTIANGARDGARYGVIKPTDTAGIQSAAVNAAAALGLSASNFKVECLNTNNGIGTGNCTFDNRMRVTGTYTFTAVVPLIPSFVMSGATTMRIESP